MTRRILLILFAGVAAFLLLAPQLPAPISEESPTPESTAKPKRTITKRQTPSPQPKRQATPTQPRYAGTWNGMMNCGAYGIIEHTMTIDVAQSSMTVWQTKNPSARMSGAAQISGDTMTLAYNGCYWTLTPEPDGKTALAKCGCGGFLGIGAWNGSAIFHRTSP